MNQKTLPVFSLDNVLIGKVWVCSGQRYAFESFVVGDLFGTNGLPVSSFRTDNWDREK